MLTIRPIQPYDAETVWENGANLYPRERGWHLEHPTLVAIVDGEIVGHTSWTYQQEQGVRYVSWDETWVNEDYRNQGIGRKLMEARAKETPGLVYGATQPDNEPMVHLLVSLGFHACQTVPGGYPSGEDAILYAREHFQEVGNAQG